MPVCLERLHFIIKLKTSKHTILTYANLTPNIWPLPHCTQTHNIRTRMHTLTHTTHKHLLEESWRQLEVLGVRDGLEKVSNCDLKADKV